MNYHNADLNPLKVFEDLMNEGNVTCAASKLSLTQPTVSNALRRLRETYGDPLFVRNGADIRPTRRAMELWAPLSRSLRTIRGTLERESFDALHNDASVTISMTDYVACIVGPRLLTGSASSRRGCDARPPRDGGGPRTVVGRQQGGLRHRGLRRRRAAPGLHAVAPAVDGGLPSSAASWRTGS